MNRPAVVVALALTVVLGVAACGDAGGDPGTTSAGPASLQLVREGGLEGTRDVWVLGEDGSLLRPPTDVAEILDADVVAAVFDEVQEARFFDLDPEYLPDDPCCDRFEYRLTVTEGDRTHTVVTMDGTESTPEALWSLIGEVLAAVGS